MKLGFLSGTISGGNGHKKHKKAQKMRLIGWLLLGGWAGALGAQTVERTTVIAEADRATVVLVIGAGGEAEYKTQFSAQVPLWQKVAAQADAKSVVIGMDAVDSGTDSERLKHLLEAESKTGGELWVVLIGHGTYDGKDAKFNLRGPDLTATDLATWLKPFKRPLAVINTASASAPFISKLAGANRVVITATRTGNEQNFARFGTYLAEAMSDPKSDLDQDGQTSLLEAFLSASARVREFYKTEGRLATEHALIDDNGDGLGTPAEWFRGTRATKKAKDSAALDGTRARQFHLVRSAAEARLTAEQRARRDELEQQVEALRETKAKLSEDEYYGKLDVLMVELARLYASPSESKPSGK
jgi:Skp family chaperone for outer membrane proteins